MKTNKGLSRRRARLSTIAFGAALAFSIWQPAEARDLRFAYYPNPTHVYAEKAWTPFAKELGERTGGELNVKMFPAQQLGSAGDSVRMLQTGIADFIFIALPYHSQELPATQAVNLPWGWDARTASNVFWRAANEPGVISAELQNAGIVPVMTLANPAYEFHSTETPLPDIASLKGLKLRSPGDVFAEIIRGVDAIPVEVKTTDQYEALQRGLLDGSIYAFSSWKSFNVNELLHHTTVGAKVVTSAGLFIATSTRVMESLTPEQQKIVRDLGLKYSRIGQDAVIDLDAKALEQFAADGLNVYEWSDAQARELQDRLAPVIDKWTKDATDAGVDSKAVIEQLKRFAAAAQEAPRELPRYHD